MTGGLFVLIGGAALVFLALAGNLLSLNFDETYQVSARSTTSAASSRARR
jgi:hypothetical protein